MNPWRMRWLTVVSAMALTATGTVAQSSQKKGPQQEAESLAELARRAREQRGKSNVAQPVREFTNDNLPAARVGSGAAAIDAGAAALLGGSTASGGGQAAAAPSEADEKERSEAGAAVKAEKEKLDKLKKELELLERETKLNKATFYGRPDYAGDKAGAESLAAQDAAITAKKTEVTETETKIAALEEKAKAVNDRLGPKAEEPKTPEEQRSGWSEKMRPLREEIARIEAELASINQERAALGNSGSNPPGAFTADRIAQLQRRRTELQGQISDLEDQARRAGTLPIRD